ncbi:PEP-CTERM putative exosortase interaction domain-containing protein [Opitutaceae bacterium TAV1]|nr:PEP-CTERM putative exosortase interaction domain-containing protein [Opitutaceae bacterium TAV1]
MKTNPRFAASTFAAWCGLTVLLVASAGNAFAQKIETIALYDFSDATNLFKDSSGGTDLSLSKPASGVSQSTDHSSAAPTEYSASFSGTQAASYKTIDFSSYTALTFDWYMKAATPTADSVLFQSNANTNSVGFFRVALLASEQEGTATLKVSHKLAGTNWSTTEWTLSSLSSWQNYTLTIDNSIVGAAGHVRLLINGIEQATTASTWAGSVAGTFCPSTNFYMGTANSSASPFTGYLQNVEIYSGTPVPVPEPASIALLLGLAGVAIAFAVRCRR